MRELSKEEKQQLLSIARKAIEEYLLRGRIPSFEVDSPALKENRGAFVTLKKHGMLRGCIGLIYPIKPLYQTVAEMAVAAAVEDPRFPPLSPEDLPFLEIEISALSPLERVENIEEIEVGKHGLYIRNGPFAGLLLPQVATEYNWDRETFLQQTCLKAGLPPYAWRDKDSEIYKFTAEVFAEEK